MLNLYDIHLKRMNWGMVVLLTALYILCPPSLYAGEAKITNDLGMTFIRINPGTFSMGSPITERSRNKDEIQHSVTITSAFYIQETEVTVAQWRAVMGSPWIAKRKQKADMPVTRVSWYDCVKYIKKLNLKTGDTYRLPTEAEWEYACRSGSQTAYAWGDGIDCSKAMFGNNTKKNNTCIQFYKALKIAPNGPAQVKGFAPNAWGIYDMHGNVWEWCADPYKEYMTGPWSSSYSLMDADSRVRRGGSWYKYPSYLRSANRTYGHPAAKFKTTGFRLVREAD